MTLRAVTSLAAALVPDVAAACATCVDSAYGSRTFNWAFVGLMLAPFAVAAGLLGGIAWTGRRSRSNLDSPAGHHGLERVLDAGRKNVARQPRSSFKGRRLDVSS